jgi:CheY-like chemotaxis protein
MSLKHREEWSAVSNGTTPLALVVDGDRLEHAVIKSLVRTVGYDVVGVISGTEGIRLLAQRSFDLIVASFDGTPIGGLGLFELLRRQTRPTTIAFVLVVSPSQREKIPKEAAERPAMVTRPFGVHALQRAIEHAKDPSLGPGDDIFEI